MNDVMRKRLIGLAILIIIGVSIPLVLSRCMHRGQDDNGRGSMRVYNVQPDGKAEPAGKADQQSGSGSDETSNQQAAGGGGSNDQGNSQHPSPDAVSPQSQTDFSTPPINGNSEGQHRGGSDSQSASSNNSATGPETAGTSSRGQRSASRQSSGRNAGSSNESGASSSGNDGSSSAQSGGSSEKTDLSGWVVQVASFGNRKNAESMVHELKGQFQASFKPGHVNGKTWYRVNVGPFKNEDAARAAAGRLKQQGHGALVRNLK